MTHLRQKMLDEIQRRNYAQNTVSTYMHAVEEFSRYFHRSPDRLGPDHIRQYQAYLFRERKLQAGTIACCTAALRFLYVKTLRRPYLPEHIPFPKRPGQLPIVLSPEEVQRVIDSAENLMRRAMVMTLYSTGIRCSELCHLKVSDIDSDRKVIRVHKGKGGPDRDVLNRNGRNSRWIQFSVMRVKSGLRPAHNKLHVIGTYLDLLHVRVYM